MDEATKKKVLKLLDENQQLLKEIRLDILDMLEDTQRMRKELKNINLKTYRK